MKIKYYKFVLLCIFLSSLCFFNMTLGENLTKSNNVVKKQENISILKKDSVKKIEEIPVFIIRKDSSKSYEGDKFGIMNVKGKMILTPKYDLINDFNPSNKITTFKDKNYKGVIDRNGKELFKGTYYRLKVCSDNLIAFRKTEKSKVGFMDVKGKVIMSPKFRNLRLYRNSIIVTMDDMKKNLYDENRKYGIINTNLKEIVPVGKYDCIDDFQNGYLRVSKNNKYGVIDVNGKEFLSLKYDCLRNLMPMFLLDDGENLSLINSKGHITNFKTYAKTYVYDGDRDYDTPCYGLSFLNKNNQWIYIDSEGNEIKSPYFKAPVKFSSAGLAPVCKNKKWGYMDKKGNIVIDFKFDKADSFTSEIEIAIVNYKGKYCCIDKKGNILSYFKDNNYYESYYYMVDKDIVPVYTDKGYGVIDKKGKLIIDSKYKTIYIYDNHILAIKKIRDIYDKTCESYYTEASYFDRQGNLLYKSEYVSDPYMDTIPPLI